MEGDPRRQSFCHAGAVARVGAGPGARFDPASGRNLRLIARNRHRAASRSTARRRHGFLDRRGNRATPPTPGVSTIAMPSPPSYLNRVMDEIATLPGIEHTHVRFDEAITLECGVTLDGHTVAYRTYGTLNAARTNAVLVCHALTARPICGRDPSDHRQARLVGPRRRAGPADRHRSLLRHLRQHSRAAAWARPGRSISSRMARAIAGAPISRQ